jgi:HAD superfamily hydrolase (TIGR01509 family)
MASQEPIYLYLSPEFLQDIIHLVEEHNLKMVYWDMGGTIVDLSKTIKERATKKINMTYHRDITVEMFDHAIRVEWGRRETRKAIELIKSVDDDKKEKWYWIEFYTCVLNNLGIRVKDRQIVKWLATVQSNPKSFEELPYVRDTLRVLRENGTSVGIISNAFPSARRILDRSGLIDEFNKQHVILSYEYNSVKPERTIYKKAIEGAKVKPQEILFIDDRKSFVDGAIKFGMKAVVISDKKGQDSIGSGRPEITNNEYSAASIKINDFSILSSVLNGIWVRLAQFKTGFLCGQRDQRPTESSLLRPGM